jgi:hypothetical protein
MPNWKTEAIKKMEALVEDGYPIEDIAREISLEYRTEIMWDAELSLAKALKKKLGETWAEPPKDMDQLRFDLNGVDVAIPDTPVRYVDEEGEVRYKPARLSTANERAASIEARIQHHISWVARSETEHTRELEQSAYMSEQGIDADTTWDEARHRDTICGRCRRGWEAGNPFEMGHYDKPKSQGGKLVRWEHRECNRSEGDNPMPLLDE